MQKYKFTGSEEVHMNGIGVVKPGDVVKTEMVINHPDFVKIENESKKKDK